VVLQEQTAVLEQSSKLKVDTAATLDLTRQFEDLIVRRERQQQAWGVYRRLMTTYSTYRSQVSRPVELSLPCSCCACVVLRSSCFVTRTAPCLTAVVATITLILLQQQQQEEEAGAVAGISRRHLLLATELHSS
jgi:hypothetical protein